MGLFPKSPTGFFFLFYILILIYFFEYETIVRNSAWTFGHSDPDSSSMLYKTPTNTAAALSQQAVTHPTGRPSKEKKIQNDSQKTALVEFK